MATIADLRAAVGASSNRMSDEELLAAYAKGANMSPNQAAMEFGWNPSTSGQWGNRASAAVDSYQSNLYGLGEALGSDWARRKRIENEFAADVSRDRAAAQGAISSFKDIGGVGDFFNYAGGLALDSAPYLGEALVGGGVGGLAARGLGLAGRAAARTAGAVGASYPSSVGDVLSNQREQAGTMDLGSAAALGVPYALANAFGIEGALARGATMKSGIQALDDMTGLRGGLARTGASVAKGTLTEAPAETFQEFMNQYGRMAVDPNETFFNPKSNERFAESFVGGGVLGGLFGGGMGGWRRSDQYYRDQQAALLAGQQQQQQQESVSLLAPEVPKVGEQFSLFGSPYTNADSDVSTPAPRALEDLLAEQAQVRAETMDVLRQKNAAEAWFHGRAGELQNAAASNESGQRWEEMASQFNRRLSELQAQSVSIEAQLEPYQRSMAFADQGGQMGLDFTRPQFPQTVSLLEWNQKREEPLMVLPNGQAVSQEQFAAFPPVVQSYLLALRQPRTRPMGLSGPTLPGVINVNPYGQAGATETQNQTLLADTTDLGTELARQRIEQGFVGEPATKQTGKAPSGTVVAAPAAKAQKEEAAWPNRPLWTQYALPAKSTEAGRTVFDQAVQAKNNGTLDAEGFERVVEGLRKHTNSGRAVLAAETSRVAGEKEQAGKPSAAPKAPKQPAVIVPAPASTSQSDTETERRKKLINATMAQKFQRLAFNQTGDGRVTVSGTLDARDALELSLTDAERKLLKRADALLELAETPEERNEASAANEAALRPAVERLLGQPAPAPASASATPGENQLLVQGQTQGAPAQQAGAVAPNVSVPNLAGQPTGGSGTARRVVVRRGVGNTGSNPAATVASAAPAAGVEASDGQAAAVTTGSPQGASTAVAARPDRAQVQKTLNTLSDGDTIVTDNGDRIPVGTVVRNKNGDVIAITTPKVGEEGWASIDFDGLAALVTPQPYYDSKTGERKFSAPATIENKSTAVEEDADTRETRELWDEWATKEGAPAFTSLRTQVREFLVRQPNMNDKTKQAALSMNASAAIAEQDEKQEQQANQREAKAAESDFNLNAVLSAIQSLPAKMQVAVRAFMGVDLRGDLAPDFEPMNARDAARKAGYAEKSSANVTRTLQKLGVTELGVQRLHARAGQVAIVDEAEVLANQGDTNAFADTDREDLFSNSTFYTALKPSEDKDAPFANSPVEAIAAAVANAGLFKTDPDQETTPRNKNIAARNSALINALMAEAASRSKGPEGPKLNRLYEQEVKKSNRERKRNEVTVSSRSEAQDKPAAKSVSDASNVIETDEQGEPLVTLSKQEQTLLLEAADNLTPAEQDALEEHYGGALSSPAVQGKLADDVVAHADGRKPKLPEVIRKIIAKLAKALLSVAVFFNVGGMNPQISSDAYARTVASMPAQVTVTQAEQRESKKADTAGRKLSPNAQRVADWIAENAEANEISQIVDPATGMMYVMKGGKIVADSPALFGKAGIGAIDAQIIGKPAASMTDADKVTPAGRFSLKLEEDEKYGSTLTFLPTNDGGGYAIHRVYLGNPAERRTERLNSKNAADNTVSYGCVNVSDAFYDEVLKKFDYSGKAFAYLLPSDASKLGQFFDLSNQNRTPAPTPANGQKFGKTSTRARRNGAGYNPDATAKNPYTADELTDEIKSFVRVDALRTNKLKIVNSVEELLNSPLEYERVVGAALRLEGAYGVAENGRAYLVANRINRGEGKAKFLHEVGSHLGLDTLLGPKEMGDLVGNIRAWASSSNDNQENRLARNALARIPKNTSIGLEDSELLAYFVEEAVLDGVDPTANSQRGSAPLFNWFRRLWAAFKTALLRSGLKPDAMTAQDVVNLAFGAARLEMSFAGTYHGTAASFNKFLHSFMGTGEGAQAYGWGSYLAQAFSLGNYYMDMDALRKTRANILNSLKGRVLARDVLDPEDQTVIFETVKGRTAALNAGVTIDDDIALVLAYAVLARGLDGIAVFTQRGKSNNNLFVDEEIDLRPLTNEGNLLRVDAAVEDAEMLNWDKPIRDQSPQVLAGLRALTQFPDLALWSGKTGGEFYKELAVRLLRTRPKAGNKASLMINGNIVNFRGDVKGASQLLDSVGIKGVKLLDSNSRPKHKVLQAYQDKNDLKTVLSHIDKNVAQSLNLRTSLDLAQDIEDSSDLQQLFARLGVAPQSSDANAIAKYKQWLGDKTHNLVVFNDRNIRRVSTNPRGLTFETKFGKNANPSASFDALNKALPPSARTATSNIATIIKTAMSGIANRVVFTHDLLERAARVGLASAADFGRLYKERAQMTNGLSGRVDDVARLYSEVPDAERGRGPGTVNDFLKDSTRTDAWGFVPDWLPEAKRANVKVDPAMAKRFAALSPQSQAYARAVFEHGYKTLELKKRTILNATVSEYNALIKAAKDAGDEDEVARLESDKSKAQTKFDSLFKTMGESPYAPLKRFGDWVVIAESKALRQARLDDDKKRIAELEQDGKHYYVDFFDSQMEALNAERRLRGLGSYDSGVDGVVVRKKEEARERLYGGDGMAAAFTKLRNQARMRLEGEQDASKRALLEMATDMYLSALAESSARKSEMRRRGIEGDIDMLRSFVAQGYADAHMVSALAFSGTQGDAINAMRREKETGSSADQTRKSQAFNEIVKRHADSMEYVEPNAIDGIKTAASIYYLAFSPAYYLQNLTQPWMVSLPVIAGKHDYGKTAAAIGKAGAELKDAWLGAGVSRALDLSKVPDDVKKMIEVMYDRGILTSGLNLEFKNARASSATGVIGRTGQMLGDVKDFINDVQTKVEVMNRASTAIAAYRLERAKGSSDEQAMDYVDRVLRETHGDYSMMAAPRFFNNNFGKLALQFRKYQLLQLSLMARLIRESFTGTDRKAAAKALGFVLGQTGLLAGAMGLPGFAAIAWILSKLFGDPNEPDDPEYKLRKAIGDKDTADLILKGLPARFGADLSGKLGWQNMLSVLPYTDIDMTKKSVTEIGMALTTGAAGAMAGKVVDGMASMKDGRYVEGLTKALPSGFANAAKAADTFTRGVRNKDGELLLSPDEINFAEAVLMGIGLTPTELSAQNFRQRVNYEATTNFADRASKIKQQFVEATREGSGRQEAIDAWMRLQDVRVSNGFKRQPMQDLYDAVKESRKQERNTLNGVQFRTTNRPFVERLGQI